MAKEAPAPVAVCIKTGGKCSKDTCGVKPGTCPRGK